MGELPETTKCYLLQNQNATVKLEPADFVIDRWRQQKEFSQMSGGRGSSYQFRWSEKTVVVREYLRGGMMAKISRNNYFWSGKNRSRSWLEYRILESARNAGLPVPNVLGALSARSGLYYRAAIMTELIPQSKTLAAVLSEQKLAEESWFRLGEVLKRLQSHLFHHKDLNANNILLDEAGNFYVIDFDKAVKRQSIGDWQWQTLFRLQRSLKKIDQMTSLNYINDDWQSLMDGYQAISQEVKTNV